MDTSALGKVYKDGEVIVRQGNEGNCMYVIQSGQVEIVKEVNGRKIRLAVRGKGEFFGEMALFEREARMATVRALGPARVLTIDKMNLLRRIHEDPFLALNLIEHMSARIRQLSEEVSRLESLQAVQES